MGSEDWFWHTLCLALGGCTVAELKGRMSLPEFEAWAAYYRARPFDDEHRYQLPAALQAAVSSRGGKPITYWLDFMIPPTVSAADASIFRAFGLEPPRD